MKTQKSIEKNFEGNAFGIYRVKTKDGFSVTVHEANADAAISAVLNSGIINITLDDIKSANIVKMI